MEDVSQGGELNDGGSGVGQVEAGHYVDSADFAEDEGPRRVKLSVSRIEPVSALKVGFLVAMALGIINVVSSLVLWLLLDTMHVFESVSNLVNAVGAGSLANFLEVLHLSRIMALVVIFSVVQVVLLSVLSWLAAVIYNLIVRLVGGLHLVLTDD